LRATIAQRLVRMLCDRCKIRKPLSSDEFAEDPRLATLGFAVGDTIFQPHGCDHCGGSGYRGRSGIFEIIEMTASVRGLITEHSDSEAIHRAAVAAGMTTMIDDAIAKCRAGVTSPAEILRVATVGG
jgi:general secretion pathway protein E